MAFLNKSDEELLSDLVKDISIIIAKNTDNLISDIKNNKVLGKLNPPLLYEAATEILSHIIINLFNIILKQDISISEKERLIQLDKHLSNFINELKNMFILYAKSKSCITIQ
jgi:hypothetical protein